MVEVVVVVGIGLGEGILVWVDWVAGICYLYFRYSLAGLVCWVLGFVEEVVGNLGNKC